jgi:AraC-like DNA-binding protein
LARTSARSDTISVRLVSLGVGRFAESFGPAASPNACWRLSFHERGRAELAAPERVFTLPPGRCVLIAPDMPGTAAAQGDALHLCVEFEPGRVRDAAALPARDAPLALPADSVRDEVARSLLRDLAKNPELSPSRCALAQALLHLCLSSALDAVGEARPASDARAQLQPALRYIDAHLADLLPNAKLAELAHASESHFIRMFRRVVGCTPARHVQERRVSSAVDFLLRSNLSIDEIAERCGFANRYHFSRVFAQRMAHPPARFRAMHASGGHLPLLPPPSEVRTPDTRPYGNS